MTTGAQVSESSAIKSPLKQTRALHLMISPAGLRSCLNAQVLLICQISLRADANQSLRSLWSRIASSHDGMSGFLFFATAKT